MPTSKRPLFALAASIALHDCRGFVSNPLRASIPQKRSNTASLLPKEIVLFNTDPNDGNDEFDASPSSLILLETGSAAADESSTRTTTTGTLNTMAQPSDSDSILPSLHVNDTILGSAAPPRILGTTVEPWEPAEVLLVNRNDDVKAVLKASELAAVEAEASIPPELMEQLGFSALVQPDNRHVDAVSNLLTATSVVGEPVTSTKLNPPTISKIIKFAIPAIGVWLCGPLLSLIDTSAVGLFSGTAQQAALNPAVALTDYSALLIVRRCAPIVTNLDVTNHSSYQLFYFRHSCTLEQRIWSQRHRKPTEEHRTSRPQLEF